jgi:hypothetical protein
MSTVEIRVQYAGSVGTRVKYAEQDVASERGRKRRTLQLFVWKAVVGRMKFSVSQFRCCSFCSFWFA